MRGTELAGRTSAAASAFSHESRPDMLKLNLSVDDPGCVKTQGATARVEYYKVIAACES